MLTAAQRRIIRASTLDDEAFERIVAIIEDVQRSHSQTKPPDATALPGFDVNMLQQLTTLLDALPLSIYIKDLDSRFVIANHQMLNSFNFGTLPEIIGKTDFDFMKPESAQFHYDTEQTMLRTGEPILDLEICVSDENRGDRWYLVTKSPICDASGRIIGLIGINRDITRRWLAEKSVESQRNMLQMVIDQIQDKIYVKDRQSRFVMANTKTLNEQRVTAEALPGTTDFDYMPAERAGPMQEEEQRIMETGNPIINKELFTPAHVTKRHDMWFLVSKIPLRDVHGNVTGLIGINRDITSRKKAQQKSLQLRLEQERSSILAAFIKDASHEFRTPLSVILTSTYLLGRHIEGEREAKYLERIVQQIERMTYLLNTSLTMLRLDRQADLPMDIERIDLFLQMVLDTFMSKTGANIRMTTQTNQTAEFNGELLAQAITAIIDNAIRFSPPGDEILVSCSATDQRVFIAVRDTGMGMLDAHSTRIFDRFYRVDKARTQFGFGLGLTIAQRIVELHQGRIEVESEIGVGSTFRIVLPIASPADDLASAGDSASQAN